MNTTTATASAINTASEKNIRFQILDSNGDTDLLLTVTKAAERAFELVANAGRWLYTTKNNVDGMTPHDINSNMSKDDNITMLVGLFNEADGVVLTDALVGGCFRASEDSFVDEDSDAQDEVVETDGYSEDEIIGKVKLVYVDDVDGASNIANVCIKEPQLVVSITNDDDGEELATVYVRNTVRAKDKLISHASFILAALSKIQRDEV